MESLRVRDRKRFEYGLRRQYLNEAGFHDSDRRRGAGAGDSHGDSPRYSMEPPVHAMPRHQANKRAASSAAPRRPRAKQNSKSAADSSKGAGVQLPSITRKKEPIAVRDNSKLRGFVGLWGSARSTKLRGDMQFELDQARQSRASRPGTADHKWEAQEQAGVKFWLNTETGEATVNCPSEVRRAKDTFVRGMNKRRSSKIKVHAAAATPDEDVTPPPTSSGTGALVYDTSVAQELFNLLDSSP